MDCVKNDLVKKLFPESYFPKLKKKKKPRLSYLFFIPIRYFIYQTYVIQRKVLNIKIRNSSGW